MDLKHFIEKNQAHMQSFIKMSHDAAGRVDYIQGGGGNTSVKLEDQIMAIKASGYSMGQIDESDAYAVLNFQTLRDFYSNTDPASLEDIEKAGSEKAKEAAVSIDGLNVLRPSVEAGFHSVLDTFVLHTHAVYGNLLTCSENGKNLMEEALKDAPYSYGFVPYVDPGARLTFQIKSVCDEVEAQKGKKPSVLLMENHGIIATAMTAEKAAELHDDANKRIADFYGVKKEDFPEINIAEKDGGYVSATPWLKTRLKGGSYDEELFTRDALYPDQLVFLAGNLAIVDKAEDAAKSDLSCTIIRESGDVIYKGAKSEALVIEQTLCCVLFIREAIEKAGQKIQIMSAAGKDFIANWESEKYRKSLVQKD